MYKTIFCIICTIMNLSIEVGYGSFLIRLKNLQCLLISGLTWICGLCTRDGITKYINHIMTMSSMDNKASVFTGHLILYATIYLGSQQRKQMSALLFPSSRKQQPGKGLYGMQKWSSRNYISEFSFRGWFSAITITQILCVPSPDHRYCCNRPHYYSISQEICTRFCCALLCCGYAIVHNEFTWSIYPYSSGLLCWHWGNR